MAMKLCQDLMMLFNDTFVDTFQENVLPLIEEVACFKGSNELS
jgi:hypothetical protein